ncbi:MAG TPA: hypothetical protein VJA66_05590 [Thermoanaerobaculia bacterium]
MRQNNARGHRRSPRIAVFLILVFVSSQARADWKIKVGPNPCDLNDLSGSPTPHQPIKRGADKIDWQTPGNSYHLHLVFHVPSVCKGIFTALDDTGMQDAAGNELYVLGNGSGTKVSFGPTPAGDPCYCDPTQYACDTIDPKNPLKGQIKYDQLFMKQGHPVVACDGWIIVKP